MSNEIPEHLHYLFDGYDGGAPPAKSPLDALVVGAPQEMRDKIAEHDKATNWVFIEHDGALFRGPSRGSPVEVWSAKHRRFIPYAMNHDPRDVSWGTLITAEQARSLASLL